MKIWIKKKIWNLLKKFLENVRYENDDFIH